MWLKTESNELVNLDHVKHIFVHDTRHGSGHTYHVMVRIAEEATVPCIQAAKFDKKEEANAFLDYLKSLLDPYGLSVSAYKNPAKTVKAGFSPAQVAPVTKPLEH